MNKRVLTVAPMPPEKSAYALARYSRSPDSIRESIEWVRTHDSAKFLESFYFQYGHASIADLGHLILCFEGISELAATEAQDEQLWDGQARSSRYQDFSKGGFITPPEFDDAARRTYANAAAELMAAYANIHGAAVDYLSGKLPRPEAMKADAYTRNIAARAFDVARYCLFLGVPTGVGQVVSIRTLERQIRRLKASEFREVAELADEIAKACSESPSCGFGHGPEEPLAPTLARHVDPDRHIQASRNDLRVWAQQNLPKSFGPNNGEDVDLLKPVDALCDVAATLLYPVTDRPFRELYEWLSASGESRQNEVIDVALQSRSSRDELLRAFRSAPYVYDILMDIGAYRDLHRHRRCQQFRQDYGASAGYCTPSLVEEAGLGEIYHSAMDMAQQAFRSLPQPGSQYILPFATKSRFLFKMDFAEAEYIARLRTGVKGHFSYREIAWKMKEKMTELEPQLGRLMKATPPWVEDPLQR